MSCVKGASAETEYVVGGSAVGGHFRPGDHLSHIISPCRILRRFRPVRLYGGHALRTVQQITTVRGLLLSYRGGNTNVGNDLDYFYHFVATGLAACLAVQYGVGILSERPFWPDSVGSRGDAAIWEVVTPSEKS